MATLSATRRKRLDTQGLVDVVVATFPKRAMPTRFACGVGTVWMLATIGAFESGNTALGYGLGGALSCVALLVATTDICIPSMIYGAIFGPTKPCSAR